MDTESMRNGVRQDIEMLYRALSISGRYLPKRFIKLWLEHNKPMLVDTVLLTPDEFLIMASNSHNKFQIIQEKLPKIDLIIEKDPKTGIYLLEQGLMNKPDYDTRLEKIMMAIPSMSIFFDFTFAPEILLREKHPPLRRKMLKMLETDNYKQFANVLKDPNTGKSLKTVLSSSNLALNKTKVNSSNFSYLNYRNDTGFLNGISEVAKSVSVNNQMTSERSEKTLKNFSSHFENRPETSKPGKNNAIRPQPLTIVTKRPATSRNTRQRPISSSGNSLKIRPSTGKILPSTVSVKDEPFHVMSLRESTMLRYNFSD